MPSRQPFEWDDHPVLAVLSILFAMAIGFFGFFLLWLWQQ
jgi:hypothetical protein